MRRLTVVSATIWCAGETAASGTGQKAELEVAERQVSELLFRSDGDEDQDG